MKTQIKLIAAAIALVIGTSSCSKDEPLSPSTPVAQTQSNDNIVGGTWKISSYEMGGMEHSDFFHGAGLEFMADGSVLVRGSDPLVKGTWKTREDGKVMYMDLQLGTQDPWSLLTHGSWLISKHDATTLEMTSRRGDDSSQKLTLTK